MIISSKKIYQYIQYFSVAILDVLLQTFCACHNPLHSCTINGIPNWWRQPCHILEKNPSRRRSSGDSHHGSTKHHKPNMHEIEPPIDTVMWSLALPWPNSPADHFSPFGTPRRNFSGQLLKSPLSNSSSSIAAQRPPHRRTETLPADFLRHHQQFPIDTPTHNMQIRKRHDIGDESNTPAVQPRKKSLYALVKKMLTSRGKSKPEVVPFEMRAAKEAISGPLDEAIRHEEIAGSLDEAAIRHEEPAAGRKCPENMNEYDTEIRFKSDIFNGNEHSVKINLTDEPFASGMQAKLYYGMFKRTNSMDGNVECVGVKLVGPGTYKIPQWQVNAMTLEQIIDDPKREIAVLQKFHPKEESHHIIQLHDGGPIEFDNDEAKAKSPFRYVVIQELGDTNLMDAFMDFRLQNDIINEPSVIIEFLEKAGERFLTEAAEVLVQIHKVAVHMDFKAENLIYVEEKVDNTTLDTLTAKPVKVLKAIDFGGAMRLPAEKMEKFSSTKYIQPPEMDQDWLKAHYLAIKTNKGKSVAVDDPGQMGKEIADDNNNHGNDQDIFINIPLSATTKSDTWEFGMLLYTLALVIDPGVFSDRNRNTWKKTISGRLRNINNLYKELANMPKTTSEEDWLSSPFNKPNNYLRVFMDILNFRFHNPRLYLLAHHLLQKDDDKRLSAQGILDYLSNECQLYEHGSFARMISLKTMQNLFIGPLDMNVVMKMHNGNHFKIIDEGTKRLEEMVTENKINEQNLHECDRNYKPGEKTETSTFDELKHALG